jgi:hypothetical protein
MNANDTSDLLTPHDFGYLAKTLILEEKSTKFGTEPLFNERVEVLKPFPLAQEELAAQCLLSSDS